MELVKETKTSKIFKKRSGRFGVKGTNGKWLNGEEKVKILLKEGLIKVSVAKPKAQEPKTEEAKTQEASSEEVVKEEGQ